MFLEESLWIKSKLEKLDLPQKAMVADFGSSNIYYHYCPKTNFFEVSN